jgi:Tfp pilus assembly protein PilP
MVKNIRKEPNKQLNEDMGLVEMNMIIEENQEYNQNFIEQVNEVSKKRKVSREKKKSPSPIKPSFSKTRKKMNTYGPSNKKLISTMRNNSKRK